MFWTTLLLIVWVLSGIGAYGITLAYFQRKFALIAKGKGKDDVLFALLYVLLGPIGLGTTYFCSERGRYGMQFKTLTDDEIIALLKVQYPDQPYPWDIAEGSIKH